MVYFNWQDKNLLFLELNFLKFYIPGPDARSIGAPNTGLNSTTAQDEAV